MRKTLQDKLAKEFKGSIREICLYGTESGKSLDLSAVTVGGLTRRVKKDIESLKITANHYGSFSMSPNQLFLDPKLFIIAKNLKDGVWFNRKFSKSLTYNVFVNPKITKVSKLMEYGWEQCASFPNIRASVKRFERIQVQYQNEEFDDVEKELSGFEARVFQHELDHLRGRHILNWDVSFGEVELIPGANSDFPNFEKALNEYKTMISKAKDANPSLFERNNSLKEINPANDEDEESEYWDRGFKNNKGILTGEDEVMDALYNAIQMDFDIHEELEKDLKKDAANKPPSLNNDPQKKA